MSKSYALGYKQAQISWKCMIARCTNPNDISYHNYGGRGITVCEEWKSFSNFLKDMGFPPDDQITGKRLTLDRKDPDKGYTKDNCQWSSRVLQAQNTRLNKENKKPLKGVVSGTYTII